MHGYTHILAPLRWAQRSSGQTAAASVHRGDSAAKGADGRGRLEQQVSLSPCGGWKGWDAARATVNDCSAKSDTHLALNRLAPHTTHTHQPNHTHHHHRDPERVALAYSEDSEWRNRSEFIKGREAIRDVSVHVCRRWLCVLGCKAEGLVVMCACFNVNTNSTFCDR